MLMNLATSGVVGSRRIRAALTHAPRARPALVCHWRQSSITGRLECAWENECIAAPPIATDPVPVSGDLRRTQQESSEVQAQHLRRRSDQEWRRSLDYEDAAAC